MPAKYYLSDMKRAALLAVLFLLPTPAAAWNWCKESAWPPVEFSGEPTRSYKIGRFPPEWIPEICASSAPYQVLGGCYEEVEGTFFITVRDDVSETEAACIIWHEKAHVNGWDHGVYAPVSETQAVERATDYEPITAPYSTHGR